MLGKKKIDFLIVGQTPPPCHGQSIVTKTLFDHDWQKVNVTTLRMAYSDSLNEVGKFQLSKITHLLKLIYRTWCIAGKQKPAALYYLPASPKKIPVIRDIIYLMCVRWCFSKTVFHYHAGGLADYVSELGLLGKLASKAYGRADLSIELSDSDDKPSEFFKACQRVVIPNGIEVSYVARQRAEEDETLQVLFVGGLFEGKGVSVAVHTAKKLKEEGCDFVMRLMGAWSSEEYKKEVLQLVSDNGLNEVIQFIGLMSGDDKWAEFANADCFFFPTHYESESFPLVLIEAMAYSLPILSTQWRGIPNLVGDDGAAYLEPILSITGFADRLLEFRNNKELRINMGKEGYQRYRSIYTVEAFTQKVEQEFYQLLKK